MVKILFSFIQKPVVIKKNKNSKHRCALAAWQCGCDAC